MDEATNETYLTLFEAAKNCPYSEAYLRLRARAGKLKSIKMGKKWMTTKAWVDDYVLQSKEWNEKVTANRMKKDALVATAGIDAKIPEPNIAQLPAGTYSLPQVEFMSLDKKPAVSIPQPSKTENFTNPRFLFVLGSGAMMALLLFAWMTADFKAGNGVNIGTGQANISRGVQPAVNVNVAPAPTKPTDDFESQMDPQVLDKALSRIENDQMTAAVSQLEMLPVFGNGSR